MKKFFIISSILVVIYSCNSSRSGDIGKEEIPVPSPVEPRPTPPESKWEPSTFEFSPIKIEVAYMDDKKNDTGYVGEGCNCPDLGNRFEAEISFLDSLGRSYGVKIHGYKLLKRWHDVEGPGEFSDAKLDKLPLDSSNDYLEKKNAYLKIINSLPGELKIFVDSLYKGSNPKLRIFAGEPKQKKIGNAFMKDEYENLIYDSKRDYY
ncbi:MAG: hypothetical protein KBC44_02210 [Candidatus Pacebacteria bacterium]|nr:hypothetical protein [Candidatus Paceibacterota bacterium]MBP9839771.1 hypothetical protein [Candidatus Paceibacterota bacterium]